MDKLKKRPNLIFLIVVRYDSYSLVCVSDIRKHVWYYNRIIKALTQIINQNDGEVITWMLNRKLHRDNGPALICQSYSCLGWYQNGILHRDNGPASIDGHYNIVRWKKNGLDHRDDGPAFIISSTDYYPWHIEIDDKGEYIVIWDERSADCRILRDEHWINGEKIGSSTFY